VSAEYHLFDTDMRFSADTSSKKYLMEKKIQLTKKKIIRQNYCRAQKNFPEKCTKILEILNTVPLRWSQF